MSHARDEHRIFDRDEVEPYRYYVCESCGDQISFTPNPWGLDKVDGVECDQCGAWVHKHKDCLVSCVICGNNYCTNCGSVNSDDECQDCQEEEV